MACFVADFFVIINLTVVSSLALVHSGHLISIELSKLSKQCQPYNICFLALITETCAISVVQHLTAKVWRDSWCKDKEVWEQKSISGQLHAPACQGFRNTDKCFSQETWYFAHRSVLHFWDEVIKTWAKILGNKCFDKLSNCGLGLMFSEVLILSSWPPGKLPRTIWLLLRSSAVG